MVLHFVTEWRGSAYSTLPSGVLVAPPLLVKGTVVWIFLLDKGHKEVLSRDNHKQCPSPFIRINVETIKTVSENIEQGGG